MVSKKISVAVLGSTGSIGKASMSILEKNSKFFKVDLISCNKNIRILKKQINKFLPKYVLISDQNAFNKVKKIKFKKKIIFIQNTNIIKNIKKKFDKVILGISSIHGLRYAFDFLPISKEILIANKETIVCGGNFFLKFAKKNKCKISSIDSEHFCLSNLLKKINIMDIDKIYITASGGPFLNKKINEISRVKPRFALQHPKWKMGKKISIDSATMANKGLEIIEASILFKINPEMLKIKIHKESKVHAIVILKNGIVHLLAHNTSMKIPIENALLNNKSILIEKNFFKNKNFFFSFDETNLKKFKMVFLAYKALRMGHRACIFYNVINDLLVNSYLKNRIFFYEIYNKLNKIMNSLYLKKYFNKKIRTIEDIYATISFAKTFENKI